MITTRDKILSAVMKPTRYTGGELNSVIKNPADVDVRFGFCFFFLPILTKSHCRIWGLKLLTKINTTVRTHIVSVFLHLGRIWKKK